MTTSTGTTHHETSHHETSGGNHNVQSSSSNIASSDPCRDVEKCNEYGDNICTEYEPWARKNCARHCKFCERKLHFLSQHFNRPLILCKSCSLKQFLSIFQRVRILYPTAPRTAKNPVPVYTNPGPERTASCFVTTVEVTVETK